MKSTQLRKVIGYVCNECDHIFKWSDERRPNYCPECGQLANLEAITEDRLNK